MSSIQEQLQEIKKDLNHINQIVALAEEKLSDDVWLTTSQFAYRKGIKAKTVANYAREGKFKRMYRTKTGRIRIHISELEN